MSEEEKEEDEEDEKDPYDDLELVQGQETGGFKYDKKEKQYCLPGYFCLPEKIYESLFEHQKQGVIWLYKLY